ncbi:DUF2635 domain-containing protein [Afifella pfennigii]|uniref:DUF2635 domain-containing protein n=1 Tax=Afifella pfennigii TaxID=209897 RepID=UPI0009FC0C16|nr:DUF2635 domain-containing protein [Afifella pfennigii]
MPEEKKLVPARGRSVPMEDGTPWPTDGKGRPAPRAVPSTSYYRRRLRDGDLVDPKAKATPASEQPANEPEAVAETEVAPPAETKKGARARKES